MPRTLVDCYHLQEYLSVTLYKYTSYQIIIRIGLYTIVWGLLKTILACSLVFKCNFEEERDNVNV